MIAVNKTTLERKIRTALWITIIGLVANGLSAFTLHFDLRIALHFRSMLPDAMNTWILQMHHAVSETGRNYPFMLYGYDWLGFAHILIAIAFIGPLRDPVKNQWVVQFGMIASILSIVMALVAEPFRGVPFFWSLIDVAVGTIAFIVLYYCNGCIKKLKLI